MVEKTIANAKRRTYFIQNKYTADVGRRTEKLISDSFIDPLMSLIGAFATLSRRIDHGRRYG